MEVVISPSCVDVQNFQFKLQRKVRAFKSSNELSPGQLHLLATASRFGILFLGSPYNQLHVFQIRNLLNGNDLQCPRRVIQLDGSILNLALNCSQELLSITYYKNNNLVAAIYDTKKCISENAQPLNEIVLSPTNNVQLMRLSWNPYQADTLAVVTSDGVLSVYQCKQNSVGAQSKAANARSLSWSPKGKQLVTGNADGTLCQWKPDLSLVKTIPPPVNLTEAFAVHWLSNTQFCVVYKDNERRPCVTIVTTPKAANPVCVNFGDICYSIGESRPMQYYLTHLPAWGVILVSSSNSMEVGVLGSVDQTNWLQWIQMDEARAELPLTEDKQDCFPVGMAFDDSAILQLPWGDNETLPFMPALHVLSHTGLLVTFFCINLSSLQSSICNQPEELLIPQHLCVLQSEPVVAPSAPQITAAPLGGSSHDISFAFPSITSTPTMTKQIPQNQGHKSVAANLFGVPGVTQPVNPVVVSEPSPPATSVIKPVLQPAQPEVIHPSAPAANTFPQQTLQIPNPTAIKQEIIQTGNNTGSVQSVDNQLSDDNKKKINAVSKDKIKSLYLKEMNEFQMHLYEVRKRHAIDTQIGTQEEMSLIMEVLEKLDVEPLNKCYGYDDVRHQITLSKQYLIKMCSILIGAKLQPESLELAQLAQLDPVSQEKMASIKKLTYYVETQLKQIANVLDDQWNAFQEHCSKGISARQQINNGDIMKMPTLDKVYQPLVKHQDILVKQQATVKTLQKLLDNLKPQIYNSNVKKTFDKSTKSTHTLSSLTKNLLNLSIQSADLQETKYKPIFENESKYSTKKYNALRELLVDRTVTRIKPVKVELSNKWTSLLENEKLAFVKQEVNMQNVENNTNKTMHPLQVGKIVEHKTHTSDIKLPIAEIGNAGALSNLNRFVSNVGNQSASQQPSFVNNAMPQSSNGELKLQQKPNQQIPASQAVSTFSTKLSDISSVITPNSFMGQAICSPTVKTEPQQSFGLFKSDSTKSNVNREQQESAIPTSGIFTSTPTTFSFKPPQILTTKTAPETTVQKQIITQSPITPPTAPGLVDFGKLSVSKTGPSVASPNTTSVKTEPPKSIFGNLLSSTTSVSSSLSNVFSNSSLTAKPVISAPTIPNNTVKLTADPPQPNHDKIESAKTDSFDLSSKNNASIPQNGNSSSPASIFATALNKTTNPVVSQSTAVPASTISSLSPSTSLTTTAPSPLISTPVSIPVTTSAVPSPVISAPATVSPSSVFGVSTIPVSKTLFSTPTTTTSAFSAPATTSTIFGGTPSGSIFGTPATTASSLFGATNSSPEFVKTPAASSLFANANANLASTGNLFESLSVTTTASSPTSVFGSPTPATCASSIFGAANSAIPSTISSLFGNASITTTTASFGSPTNNSGSIFGSSTFSQSSGNSMFGGGGSVFSQTPSQPQGNVFGGSAFGSSSFGSPSNNIFGQSNNTTQNSNNIFGSPPNVTTPSAFGGTPNQGQSLFGSPTSFGSPTAQNSVFGGATSFGSKSLFGQSSFGSPTSGGFGSFSAAGDQQSIGQAGFGTPSSFGKTGGFGSAPGFGSPPAFGSSPTFGGSPAFGASPTKMFGSPGVEAGFGNSQSSTFENLANQSTVTFGNLAQQSQPAPAAADPFQSSKSFTSWR